MSKAWKSGVTSKPSLALAFGRVLRGGRDLQCRGGRLDRGGTGRFWGDSDHAQLFPSCALSPAAT